MENDNEHHNLSCSEDLEIIGDIEETYALSGAFKHSRFVCTDGVDLFLVTSPEYSYRVDVTIAFNRHRELIPPEAVYPTYDAERHSRVPEALVDECYVKRPRLTSYVRGKDNILRLILNEVEVCEKLKQSPHKNIATYLGCWVERNRIVGLCFERLEETMEDRSKRSGEVMNLDDCIAGVRSGIEHLHRQGFCHNDINPANIMFRDDETPVIIDFDSCQYTGRELGMKKGTTGFCDMNTNVSAERNDLYSLRKVLEFLRDEVGQATNDSD